MAEPAVRRPRHGRTAGPNPARLNQSVRISPDLRGRLRMWAAYQGKEISAVVEEAVSAHLDALDRERVGQGLDPMPCPGAEVERPPGERPGAGGEAKWPPQR